MFQWGISISTADKGKTVLKRQLLSVKEEKKRAKSSEMCSWWSGKRGFLGGGKKGPLDRNVFQKTSYVMDTHCYVLKGFPL